MAFAALYGAILIVAYVTGLMQDDAAEVWWSDLFHVAVLLCGLVAAPAEASNYVRRQAATDVGLNRNIDTQPEQTAPNADS